MWHCDVLLKRASLPWLLSHSGRARLILLLAVSVPNQEITCGIAYLLFAERVKGPSLAMHFVFFFFVCQVHQLEFIIINATE